MTQQLAIPILYEWFKKNADTFYTKEAQIEFRDSGDGKAIVRIDSLDYMTDLHVKDKGFSLGVEVIDRETDETTFPRTGKCKTQEEFEKELEVYLKWYQSEDKAYLTNND